MTVDLVVVVYVVGVICDLHDTANRSLSRRRAGPAWWVAALGALLWPYTVTSLAYSAVTGLLRRAARF